MDYLKNLFAGQKPDEVLERAFLDAKEDLEDAIDLILRANTRDPKEPPGNNLPNLEATPLEQTPHQTSVSLHKTHIGTRPIDPPSELRKSKHRRKESPNSTSPITEMSQTDMPPRGRSRTSVVTMLETFIVISDDEDEVVEDRPSKPVPAAVVQVTEEECLKQLLEVFPDICRDYVSRLYKEAEDKENIPERFIINILDEGSRYPKEKERLNRLKRKRQDEHDDGGDHAAEMEYASAQRGNASIWYKEQARARLAASVLLPPAQCSEQSYFDIFELLQRLTTDPEILKLSRILLQIEFASIPAYYINNILHAKQHLYPAFFALELVERTFDTFGSPPYQKLKKPRKLRDPYKMSLGDEASPQMVQRREGRNEILAELHAARAKRKRDELKRQADKDAQVAASLNEKEHVDTGMMMECQCCFDECPFDRMTHCNGDGCHFFCLDCAKRNADNEIGQSRYKLRCMDGSGCQAEFSREQIQRFLDSKTIEGLSRIQQEEEIRMAKLEGLTKCPFCDFAAICPPVEVDREFRCRNSDCEKISCRLCRQETHIPLSCEAFAKENKATIRHAVEEAMTEALVRSCNNCKNKYIKENGCNKMMCTRCRSIQCYVCSKTITDGYKHFDDAGRGGGTGNCPLFDNTDQRHENDVRNAEKAALAKIRAENPDVSEDDLEIKVSDSVLKDEQKRLQAAAARPPMAAWPPGPPGYVRGFFPPPLLPPQPYQPANFQADAVAAQRPDWALPLHHAYYQPPNAGQPAPLQQPPRVFIHHHHHIPVAVHGPARDPPQRRHTVLAGNRVIAVPPPPEGPPPNRRRVQLADMQREVQMAERTRQRIMEMQAMQAMQAEQAAEVARAVEDQLHLVQRYGFMRPPPNFVAAPGAAVNDFMMAARPGRLPGPPAM